VHVAPALGGERRAHGLGLKARERRLIDAKRPRNQALRLALLATPDSFSALEGIQRASRKVCAMALASRKSRMGWVLCIDEREVSGAC
jgi:hypothetical protein